MKRVIIIAVLLLAGMSVFSQHLLRPENLPLVDEKLISFGFTLGMHTQMMTVKHTDVKDEEDILWRSQLAHSTYPGFTVGMIADLRLIDGLHLRFVPTLIFGNKFFNFSGLDMDGKKIKEPDHRDFNILSTMMSFPLYLKYRGSRYGNTRPYLLAGGGVYINLTGSKGDDSPILLKRIDPYMEFGVGLDIYLPYFKLAPELKMCIGFNDMLKREREYSFDEHKKYNNAIDRLLSRLITLTFNFE